MRSTNQKVTDDMVSNLYIKPTKDKGKNKPHYPNFDENYFHMADLIFLPDDDGYRYGLTVVDVGSRLMDVRPLKSKTGNEIIKAFKSIYKGKFLKPPTNVIAVDSGSEFKGDVGQYLKKDLGVHVKTALVARHRQQGVVEIKHKELAKYLFRRMSGEELITGEINRSWVDYLPEVVQMINDRTRKNFKKKKDVDIRNADVLCEGDACDPIEQGTFVRAILDAPRDVADNKRLAGTFRESDIRFDPKTRTVMKTLMAPNTPIMYLLDDGKGDTDYQVAYTKNQLQIIPPNEKKPDPKKYIRGNKQQGVTRFVVEELLERKKEKNKIYFLVKWTGDDTPTWEPRSNLILDVPDMVKDFESSTE